MARKQAHEDHVNHEAWAIPYGDMLVLLLALFVVMYAVSSVNEGKYRVLADSLQAEFSGAPRSVKPVQIGTKQTGSEPDSRSSVMRQRAAQTAGGPMARRADATQTIRERLPMPLRPVAQPLKPPNQTGSGYGHGHGPAMSERRALQKMGDEIEDALGTLVKQNLVRVRASEDTLEVEIRADILFPSGSSQFAVQASSLLGRVAEILKRFPNPMRVEGHTDAMPIATSMFPSNWELSSARAASVVHLFVRQGIEPERLSVAGYGEYRPAASNDTVEGRNRNRRVVVVVLARSNEAMPDVDVSANANISATATAHADSSAKQALRSAAGAASTAAAPSRRISTTVAAAPPGTAGSTTTP